MMNLNVYVFCLLISLTYAFEHTLIISKELQSTECEKITETVYKCSLNQAFHLLQMFNYSVDIIVESGSYALNTSYTFKNLCNIRLSSEHNDTLAEIKCMPNITGNHSSDTGLAFVGVENLTIEYLTITGCGMKHNSSVLIKTRFIILQSALFIQNSSGISIFNVSFVDNNGVGLLIYDTNGTVNIVNSLFMGNKLREAEATEYLAGGGGIYIEFTKCTPGIPKCDPKSNRHHACSHYVVDHCRFVGNIALYNYSDNEPDQLASNIHLYYGVGGGLSVQLHGHAHDNTVVISNNYFDLNKANSGGGLTVDIKQNAGKNSVTILNSLFYNNSADAYPGGGGAYTGIALYRQQDKAFNNSYVVTNCTFEGNRALNGVGGGMMWWASHEPDQAKATNRFKVSNSTFMNNEAQYGSAIQINKEYHATVVEGNMLTFIIDGCTFTGNNLRSINFTKFDSVGAVSSSGVNVLFLNVTRFDRNNSTALVVDGASVGFFKDSYTEFCNNTGLHGGAILLIGESWIQVHSNSTLLFVGNKALAYGGAIYVELSTPYEFILSHSCFVRYFNENNFPHEWNTNFTFINNTALQINNAIFANTLQPCLKSYVEHTCDEIFLYKKPFYYHPNNTNMSFLIMTSPISFNFSIKDTLFDIIPGEVYNLKVHLGDELCQDVADVIFIANCVDPDSPYALSFSPVVSPLYRFTNGSIQIAGKPKETCNLQLKTNSDYQATKMLSVTLLDCPPGFMYNDVKAQCDCAVNQTYFNPVIESCDLTLFQAHYNPLYWVGYKSDNSTNLLYGLCPYRYCYTDHTSQNQLLPRNANKTTLDKYVCGDRNRTGLLCGECIDGYSVLINSPTFACYKCKSHHVGIVYLLLSYIIPVSVLFFFVMTYNIRMTRGPFSAFLFYSQIISSQYHRNVDYFLNVDSPATLSASNILLTIYGTSNLNFFQHERFSYCLFAEAGTVDVLAFNTLLSLYPLVLITVYFILRRLQYNGLLCRPHSTCFNKFRFPNNPVTHGICAFLVLTFASINATVFMILKSTDISEMDGAYLTTVVYMQGNVEYFRNAMYTVYAIGSLLLLVTVIVVPTVILMLYPFIANLAIIFRWEESRGLQILNKCLLVHRLKPILDSFQGDYKHHLHFFSGVHFFLYRSLFFCIVVTGSTPDVNTVLVFIIIFFFLITTLQMLTMPFKSYVDNAAYSSVYMLMLALWAMEYYLLSSDKSDYTVTLLWFKIILSSLPLCCFVFYWILKLVIRLWYSRRAESPTEQPLLAFPDRLIVDRDDEYDDDDDDNEDQ